MNGSPGFFRLWVGRIVWGLVLTIPLAGFILVVLMISAQIRALDHARTALSSANSLMISAMKAEKPESVPTAVSKMADATGTTIYLFRNDGSPAYSDLRSLEHLKPYTSIPPEWAKSPHAPTLFPWPSSSLPTPLTHEVERIFLTRSSHLVTDRQGHASPLALGGGFAVWSSAIPNRTACARCHGFDREVLGHWVAIARIAPVTTPKGGMSFWGFWPLPGANQKILFGGTAGLLVFSIFVVSLLESWTLRRAFKGKKITPKKGKGTKEEEPTSSALDSEATPETTVSHEGWQELHLRLETLDKSILALAEEIPRPGILPKKPADEVIAVHATLGELLADWSDRFELDLQEISGHQALASDPILRRFLDKARELREKAVSYADMASAGPEEKSFGALKSPFFESLSDDQKDWTDRLRTVLGHLHAEIRAMEGISKSGVARTEGAEKPLDASAPSPPKR